MRLPGGRKPHPHVRRAVFLLSSPQLFTPSSGKPPHHSPPASRTRDAFRRGASTSKSSPGRLHPLGGHVSQCLDNPGVFRGALPARVHRRPTPSSGSSPDRTVHRLFAVHGLLLSLRRVWSRFAARPCPPPNADLCRRAGTALEVGLPRRMMDLHWGPSPAITSPASCRTNANLRLSLVDRLILRSSRCCTRRSHPRPGRPAGLPGPRRWFCYFFARSSNGKCVCPLILFTLARSVGTLFGRHVNRRVHASARFSSGFFYPCHSFTSPRPGRPKPPRAWG